MADTAVKRLQKEYRNIQKSPVPNLVARPSATNILDWHWILWGTAGSDFEGGVYHGKIVFPKEYPFKPPAISMVTPNGRFSTNMRLCLSMSDCTYDTLFPCLCTWGMAVHASLLVLTGLRCEHPHLVVWTSPLSGVCRPPRNMEPVLECVNFSGSVYEVGGRASSRVSGTIQDFQCVALKSWDLDGGVPFIWWDLELEKLITMFSSHPHVVPLYTSTRISGNSPTFRKVFPDYAAKLEQQQAEEAAKLVAAAPTSGATPGVAERGTGPPAQLADTAKGPFSFLVNVGIFICLLCVMAVPLLEWT
eukprot:jgi/Mesvir1/5175/Mv15312-RA.1